MCDHVMLVAWISKMLLPSWLRLLNIQTAPLQRGKFDSFITQIFSFNICINCVNFEIKTKKLKLTRFLLTINAVYKYYQKL